MALRCCLLNALLMDFQAQSVLFLSVFVLKVLLLRINSFGIDIGSPLSSTNMDNLSPDGYTITSSLTR